MKGCQTVVLQMGSSPTVRALREQRDRLKREYERRLESYFQQSEADRLRQEIRSMGEEPIA